MGSGLLHQATLSKHSDGMVGPCISSVSLLNPRRLTLPDVLVHFLMAFLISQSPYPAPPAPTIHHQQPPLPSSNPTSPPPTLLPSCSTSPPYTSTDLSSVFQPAD